MALTVFTSTGALNIRNGFVGGRGPDNNGAVGGAAGAVPPQQGPITANVSAACPAGCGLLVKVESVFNKGRRTGGGHDIEVRWSLGATPPEIQIDRVSISVEATMQKGRVQKGNQVVSPKQSAVVIAVKGLPSDGEAKSFRVTATALASLRQPIQQIEILKAEVRVGHEVFVQWVFPKQVLPACDTAKDVEVDVQARLSGGGRSRELSGRDVLNIENTSTVVKLKGPSSDGDVENFKVQVRPINRVVIACSDVKTGAF